MKIVVQCIQCKYEKDAIMEKDIPICEKCGNIMIVIGASIKSLKENNTNKKKEINYNGNTAK